jgi:predicted nuclease of predicted toxin-antitoxin system
VADRGGGLPQRPSEAALRLLIDACLTPSAVAHLERAFGPAGVDAVHLDSVLPRAASDERVMDWAASRGRLVITANGADFLALARRRPNHCGLGLVADQSTRVRQIATIERLVHALLAHLADDKPLRGYVFTLRKSGQLAVRRIP